MSRPYRLGRRSSQAHERRVRIVEAGLKAFTSQSYEDVTLERVAADASVSLKTVVRAFRTKEGLFIACAKHGRSLEESYREVAPGDIRSAVRVLARRYEETGDYVVRYLALEDRLPAVARMLALSRKSHLQWLAAVFAPWLPSRRHSRRLAQLFGATEIYVWHLWRKRLGFDRKTAEAAMLATLEALVRSWGGS